MVRFGYEQFVPITTIFSVPWLRAHSISCIPILHFHRKIGQGCHDSRDAPTMAANESQRRTKSIEKALDCVELREVVFAMERSKDVLGSRSCPTNSLHVCQNPDPPVTRFVYQPETSCASSSHKDRTDDVPQGGSLKSRFELLHISSDHDSHQIWKRNPRLPTEDRPRLRASAHRQSTSAGRK